jgi:phosphate-selective porin OprO/OprP
MSISMTLAFLWSLAQAQDPKMEPKPDPKAEAPKQEKSPIDVWFEDGLRFKTKDGNFEGRIGGRFLLHYRAIFDRPQEANAAPIRDLPNTFFVRQARFETEGTILKDWGYKVQLDFPSGAINQSNLGAASASSGTLRDAFVEWKRMKELQIRFGQFFEPLSQEDTSSTRFIDFAERSVINRLLPGREIGIQVAGSLMDSELSYAVMLCNGNALLNDQGRAVIDLNDQKEVAALLRYSPFMHSGGDFLKGLRLGMAASYGAVDNVPTGNFDLISTELSVMYAEATGAGLFFDGFRGRLNPQISWPIGPFCFRGEYLYRTDALSTTAGRDAQREKAWYAYVTYILTGEDKNPENRIVPKGDWGAVELGFRVSQLRIVDGFESGVFPAVAGNAERVTAFTFGANWWVTRNVRFTLDIIREKYSDPVQFDTRRESMLMGMLFRAQVDF